jgi:subtilisin family serine protease
LKRFAVVVLTCTSLAVLAGCGGGGGSTPAVGSSGSGSGSGPTPSGGSLGTTSYAVQSVPSGLAVTVANNGKTTSSTTTPTTVTPAASNFATTITVTPTNGNAPYAFVVDQRNDGAHTALYNQNADTSGSIATVSSSSSARRLATASRAAPSGPRFFSRGYAGLPTTSSTRLVVRYRTAAMPTGPSQALDIERAVGAARGVGVGFVQNGLATRIVTVAPGDTLDALAARLRARSEVASVEPERLYYRESSTAVPVNDTHYNNSDQWYLFADRAANAWGYTEGSNGIAIAIVDTGADFNHPDLQGGKITFAESILSGVKTQGAAAAQDTDGHGTNVAGIAAADTNNAYGFAGLGFKSSLQIYKVFPNGTASNKYMTTANSGDVTQAIYDAVANGARIINLSVGTCQAQGVDTMQQQAVDYALAHGVVVVAASGNERVSSSMLDPACQNGSSTVDFPAAYDGVIAVGASAAVDTSTPNQYIAGITGERVASYSNAGPGLALVAPGADPTSADQSATVADPVHWIEGLYTTTPADPTQACQNPSDCAALFAGTSQAAPQVAAAAALLLAVNPGLTPAQVKTILVSTADDIGDPNEGGGRLDAYRALAAATGDANPPALPAKHDFVAFAYVPNGTNVPQILDVTYPQGVPVNADGTFRIVDIPSSAPSYKIGVWQDANGDGKVDAGDQFGSSALCSANAPCASAQNITTHPVAGGFVLN